MIKRLIPWVFIAGVVGVLVGLGAWQLERLAWKETLLQQYEVGLNSPVLALSDITSDTLDANAYRRVTANGTFLHDKEVHLGGRRWYSKPGYEILTPLKLKDGRIFLINRGWVPYEKKEPALRPETLEDTGSDLHGVLRFPKQPNFITPSNHPDKNFWFSVDFPAIEQFTGLTIEPVIMQLTADEPDINHFPIVSDGERVFRNDHLGYAITWFALAAGAIIMFWARIIRQPKNSESQD